MLETLLKEVPKDCFGGFFFSESTDVPYYEVKIWTGQVPHRGLVDITVVVEQPTEQAPMPPEKIYQLVEEFGGDYRAGISMQNATDLVPEFNLGFSEGKYVSYDNEKIAAARFQQREKYQNLFHLLGVEYQEREDKLFISEHQERLRLTPAALREAYSFLCQQGAPSLGSAHSRQRSFNLYQHPRKEGRISTSLHLRLGGWFDKDLFPSKDFLTSQDINRIERTLEKYGIIFTSKSKNKFKCKIEYQSGTLAIMG